MNFYIKSLCRPRAGMAKILLVMRLIVVLLTTAILQVSASSYGQNVTLKQHNARLTTVLDEIRKQTGYDFFYSEKTMNSSKPVNVDLKNVGLLDALELCFRDQPLAYSIENKAVTIKAKTPSFLDNLVARITAIDVRGRVVDENGRPLEGATVMVKGTTKAAKSNDKGNFSIDNVADDGVLQIRYVGYKTLEINLKDAVMPLEIKLNVATGELEEVNVTYSTGYQNIPKERATGSFVQIDNEIVNRGVSPNILDRIAYLTSSLRKGNNGATSNTDISIRGLSTIDASMMRPLIVIDGFPYEEASINTPLQLDNLNANNVESVTILRDAAAASIWGARSANGVIVITTKKGKFNQKVNINFRGNTTLTERPDLFKLNITSSQDVMDYEKKLFATGFYNDYDNSYPSIGYFPIVSPVIEILSARKRNAITQEQADRRLAELANHDTRNDVNKYLLRTSITQQYHFDVSGGGDKMAYRSSVSYNNSTANEIGNSGNTLTINLNNTYRPIKNLELNTYLNYAQIKDKANSLGYQQFLADGRRTFAPYTMLADANGNPVSVSRNLRENYIDTLKTQGLLDWHYRPLEELNNQDNINKRFNLRFGGGIKYSILQGLDINLTGQYNRSTSNNENYQSLAHYDTRNYINSFMFLNASGQPQYPVPLGGVLDVSNRLEVAYDLRSTLNFNKVWGIHNVSAIGGVDIRESQGDSNTSRTYGYDPLTLGYIANIDYTTKYLQRPFGNGSVSINPGRAIDGILERRLSYYSNIGYTLLNKYVLTASGRIDAANLFGMKANLKAKPNWSVGAAWDITKENFFNSESISLLKFRTTYGYNGNVSNSATSLPVFRYQPNSQTGYNIPAIVASLSSPPNPGLTWEKVRLINLALDFGVFNNRLSGSLEYYTKKTNNLLGLYPIEPTSGVTTYTGNTAGLKAKGIDLNLDALVLNNNLKLRSQFSISFNSDEVTEYYVFPALLNSASNYFGSIVLVGKPRYHIHSYQWGGLDGQTGNPMGILNGQIIPFSTSISNTKPQDLVYHGHATPTVSGNMLNDISYKGFSVSFNITYNFGYYFRRSSIDFNQIQSFWGGHGDYGLRWQKPGDEKFTNVPSAPVSSDNRYSFYGFSEALVEKGDHIRLRDLRFLCNLNNTILKKLPFKNIALSVMADNLNVLLWRANKQGIDPDFNNTIPSPRSITFGLNLNF